MFSFYMSAWLTNILQGKTKCYHQLQPNLLSTQQQFVTVREGDL